MRHTHKVHLGQVYRDPSIRRGLLEHPDMKQGDWLDKGHMTPHKVPLVLVHRESYIRLGLLEHTLTWNKVIVWTRVT
jgi:hypothetical protein